MTFRIFTTTAEAKSLGCTHHAREFGLIPGYYGMETGVWVLKSDLLIPLEWIAETLWWILRDMRGEDRDYGFDLRGRL